MAVTVLDAWDAATTGDPTGTIGISAGSDRLLVCGQTYEFNGQASVSTFTVGGQTYDGVVEIFWENGESDQYVGFYYWKEATIAAMSGSAVSYTDDLTLGKETFSFATYAGVDQATPVTDENKGTNTSTDQISLTTTSTTDDYDVVAVSRSSNNRDITSWGTLTEQWNSAVAGTYWTGCAHDAGGVSPIVIDGDGIAGDITYSHIIINAAGGNMDLSVRGTSRGNMRGVARGIG
jgi:hypothetical protein